MDTAARGTQERRDDLAAFLRARRQALSPDQVGLPAGANRRRTPGLRREEVAVLAGLSPTWYASLEQGRRINPSSAVLDSLCGVLRLDPRERRYVFELAHGTAGGEPTVESESEDRASLSLRTVMATFAAWPYPVYAVDGVGNLLEWNRAVREWLADFAALSAEERNLIRWMFLAPDARRCFVDWERQAREMIAILRAHRTTSSARSACVALVDDLAVRSPEFRSWWNEHEVAGHESRFRILEHPERGPTPLRVTVLHPADDMSVSIALHCPAADPTP